jgi:hypothetical protein
LQNEDQAGSGAVHWHADGIYFIAALIVFGGGHMRRADRSQHGDRRDQAGRGQIAIFTFDDDWGNSRGFIWKISWERFL